MAHYMLQVSYTPEAWATIIKDQQNRIEAVKPVVEKLGGKVETGWLCFGDYYLIAIVQMPTAVDVAAFSLAASAGGAVRAIKTTPLLTMDEGLSALKKAASAGYQAPKQKGQSA